MCSLKALLASLALLFGRRHLVVVVVVMMHHVMVIVMMHDVMTMVHHRRFSGFPGGLSESRCASNRRCKYDCGNKLFDHFKILPSPDVTPTALDIADAYSKVLH
jgi:hypothetical protein